MAKTLKVGQTYTDHNGDVWDSAVLHVDYNFIDWLEQTLTMEVCIYKDTAARTAKYRPLKNKYRISKAEFLANFNQSLAITTLKTQCEDYALGLSDHNGTTYGTYFE